MALLFECTPQCARKLLDTADIVREAMLRQLTQASSGRWLPQSSGDDFHRNHVCLSVAWIGSYRAGGVVLRNSHEELVDLEKLCDIGLST